MFSFFVTVAEGAEGPSSGFEVIGRELAELNEGSHKKPWTISLHNHTILIHHKQNYFIQHTTQPKKSPRFSTGNRIDTVLLQYRTSDVEQWRYSDSRQYTVSGFSIQY